MAETLGWEQRLADLHDGEMPDDLLLFELENALEALRFEKRASRRVAELQELLRLGAWPVEILRAFFSQGEEAAIDPLDLLKRRRAREDEIEKFPIRAFIALPFNREGKFVYDRIIRPACHWEGVRPVRADLEMPETDSITKLRREMEECDLFIADLSGNRPNVYYEVGYLERSAKPGLFLSARSSAKTAHYLGSREIIYLKQGGVKGPAVARCRLRWGLRGVLGSLRNRG